MKAMLWLKLRRMKQETVMYVIMTAMALLLTFIFGKAMFSGGGVRRLAVTDNDNSALSAAFAASFDSSVYEIEMMNADDAERSAAKGETLAAVVIPKGFEQSLKSGTPELTILRTADSADIYALQSEVRSAYRNAAHAMTLHDALEETLSGTGVPAPSLEDVRSALSEKTENKPVTVNDTMLEADDFDEKFADNIHYMMGFNIFFVMFSVIYTLSSILEDKKLHTWNRIRISPLPSRAVLAGHFIPAYAVGIAQMAIVLFLGQWLFGINLGAALLPVFAVFAAYVLAAACLGLLLAVTFKTYEQMNAAVPVIIVGMSMLGGCMWPLSVVNSDILIALGKCTPQYWAMDGAEKLAVLGGSIGSAAPNLGILFGIALLLFMLSMMIDGRRQRT